MQAATQISQGRKTVRLILFVAGLVFGGGLGWMVGRLAKSGLIDPDRFGWSDVLAALISASLLVMGVIIAIISLNRRAAARVMALEEGRPATPAQTSFYRQQAVVVFLSGLMMAAPLALIAVYDPVPGPMAWITMIAIVAVFLLQTAYNLTLWRRADEMLRQVISETGAVCFWILQGALFLWACAEKLALAPALSTWDLMSVMMAFYLVVSGVIATRRGLN